MRSRGLILALLVLALFGTACGGADPAPPAADRAVGENDPNWDVEQAILRTVLIEANMQDGLSRDAAGCMVDAVTAEDAFTLAELEGVDMTARVGSGVSSDLAAALADALVDCGPSLRDHLETDIPGALAIPGTHSVEADCVTNAYVEAWREAYAARFQSRVDTDEEPVAPDVSDRVVGIIAGCDAGGAVILGASNDGDLDTFALSTLEWECLDSRITPDEFLPAFPFPDEPGDALDRMGGGVLADVAFCEAWVSGDDVPDGSADTDTGNGNGNGNENFDEPDDANS
ncbi:MAG: hypothetical protein RIB98_09515 [Acidimicrobiales bacterium]